MEQVKIKSIRKLPKKLDRYDLTINSTHNFFANNITRLNYYDNS